MKLKKPPKLELMPLGMIGGPNEFEEFYPSEMTRLGVLTAYWSLVEATLCRVLAALLNSHPKAEAIFYSTANHKARRDMVVAAAKNSNLTQSPMVYLNAAIGATKKAADARNDLLHGLFKMEPGSGELRTVHKRPAAKVPEFTRKDVLKEIFRATSLCELAVGLLGSAAFEIRHPGGINEIEELSKRRRAERRASRDKSPQP